MGRIFQGQWIVATGVFVLQLVMDAIYLCIDLATAHIKLSHRAIVISQPRYRCLCIGTFNNKYSNSGEMSRKPLPEGVKCHLLTSSPPGFITAVCQHLASFIPRVHFMHLYSCWLSPYTGYTMLFTLLKGHS